MGGWRLKRAWVRSWAIIFVASPFTLLPFERTMIADSVSGKM